jgi:hypothetical protein
MRERELSMFVPVESHGELTLAHRTKPGDKPGDAVVGDDCHLSGIFGGVHPTFVAILSPPSFMRVWGVSTTV